MNYGRAIIIIKIDIILYDIINLKTISLYIYLMKNSRFDSRFDLRFDLRFEPHSEHVIEHSPTLASLPQPILLSNNDNNAPNKTSNIYLYLRRTNNLVNVDEYISSCDIKSVTDLLGEIKKKINVIEQPGRYVSDDKIIGHKIFSDDIVCMCVNIYRWRRGFGFVFLQISGKNEGSARISAFTTDTVHHSATCFGTTPDAEHASDMIDGYLGDPNQVDNDLYILKQSHYTAKNVFTLRTDMEM